jgi:hypothetical protein
MDAILKTIRGEPLHKVYTRGPSSTSSKPATGRATACPCTGCFGEGGGACDIMGDIRTTMLDALVGEMAIRCIDGRRQRGLNDTIRFIIVYNRSAPFCRMGMTNSLRYVDITYFCPEELR